MHPAAMSGTSEAAACFGLAAESLHLFLQLFRELVSFASNFSKQRFHIGIANVFCGGSKSLLPVVARLDQLVQRGYDLMLCHRSSSTAHDIAPRVRTPA